MIFGPVANEPLPAATSKAPHAVRYLNGRLCVPSHAAGLAVLFQGGSGSGENVVHKALARSLEAAGMATCVLDLLEPEEAGRREMLYDVELLTERLETALDWLSRRRRTRQLPIALIGSGYGASAALAASYWRSERVAAAICCGGRPDLAPVDLSQLSVPTLLVVPGREKRLMEYHERAFLMLRCPSQLAIIRGASARFTEPGTMAACDSVVREWCEQYLRLAARR